MGFFFCGLQGPHTMTQLEVVVGGLGGGWCGGLWLGLWWLVGVGSLWLVVGGGAWELNI